MRSRFESAGVSTTIATGRLRNFFFTNYAHGAIHGRRHAIQQKGQRVEGGNRLALKVSQKDKN